MTMLFGRGQYRHGDGVAHVGAVRLMRPIAKLHRQPIAPWGEFDFGLGLALAEMQVLVGDSH